MKKTNYRDLKRMLRASYFAPEPGSRERLLEKLGISSGELIPERRFTTGFRVALAAAAVLVILLNINSIRPEYLSRYRGDTVVAMARSLDGSGLWEKILLANNKRDGGVK